MKRARGAFGALTLAGLLFLNGIASAVVKPNDGQADYEKPLPSFDLFGYHSAATDADRAEVEAALTGNYGGAWSVYAWNPQSRTPSEMIGSGADVASVLQSSESVRQQAERIIEQNAATFRADLAGLRFEEATSAPPVTDSPDGIRRPGKWAAHFQQVYHDIDVVGGEVHLTFTDSGRLFALGSTYYSDVSVDWTPSLSADRAKEIARETVPFAPATDSVEETAKLLVLPVPRSESQVEHHLIWQVRVHTEHPRGIWVTSVDAHSGEIVARTNDIHFVNYQGSAVGQVERLSYCNGSHQEVYPYQYVSVLGVGSTYANASGGWVVPYGGNSTNTLFARLLSPYVDVQNVNGTWAGVFATVTPGVPYQINWNNTNSRADERDVYRTVGDIHDFFETFAPGFAFTNTAIVAHVNINDTCNAFFDGVSINFFKGVPGCANSGTMMDVVAHEYGHGIQQAILGDQGTQGLGEGNGDVTAFLFTMSSIIGRGFYDTCMPGDELRDCNNTLVYPDDVVGQEIHDAGRVIAGFHWDAMQDQIARYGSWGRYSTAWDWHWGRVLQHPTTQPAQVLATFIANDDDGNLSNGTPQFNSYCLAATNHGFTCPSVTLPLTAGACDTYHQGPQGYSINQQSHYWTVVGVSPSFGDDKDMSVYTAGYGSLLASSAGTVGTDFVVGDFNHNPVGTYQPYVSYGSATSPFVTEWDSGADAITIGTEINGSVGGGGGSCGLVRVWDVFLTAGQTYSIGLLNYGGVADMRLSLFRNPASATYWAGRSSAVFELQADNSRLYTAPATDWYGVVVFNNAEGPPASGSYALRVENAPTVLASRECQRWNTSPRSFSFNQGLVYWAGVAVNPGQLDDKDIAVYTDPAGAGTPLASSTGVDGTDFVVGDFNFNPTGTYYSRVSYGATAASYLTEWDGSNDSIFAGEDKTGTVGSGAGACGLIEVWDAYLDAGQSYRFLLLTGGANIRMSLFRNPGGGTYWAGRSSAEFEAGDADGRTYTAPSSGWYGVVVFNNAPGAPAGSYTLRMRNQPADLTSASCVSGTTVPQLYGMPQLDAYWSAVAINPSGADDKDILLFNNADGIGSPIAYSTGTIGTDFVIGDFNHNVPGSYFPMATYGTSPANYLLEWDSGPDIFPIGLDVEGTVGGGEGACDLIKVWDVFLEEGTTYQISLSTSGDADIRTSLYRNPGNATYWADRFSGEFELQPGGSPYTYVAPASDYYGLVVYNAAADSPAGSYVVRVDGPSSAVEPIAAVKPGITFQNPYPTGSPILLRAGAEGTAAQVKIYNVQGQLVRSLFDASIGTTARQLAWDGRADGGARLGAGVYLLNARIGGLQVNRSLLVLR